jgi:hypothetical protein
MVWHGLAGLALLGLAAGAGADESVDRVVLGVLGFEDIAVCIFFGCVLGVALG